MIELYPYFPATFLTPQGAARRMRQLRKRFPENLRNWRFVTLTIDPSKYSDQEQAYEVGSRRIRQFMYLLKKAGYNWHSYCWKLEFQASGRAHWHLLVEYKRVIPAELITKLWGLGRTDIEGVLDSRLGYVFKYVAKGLDDVPDWVAMRTRIRLFQASKGFYSADDRSAKESAPSPRQGIETTDADTENDVPYSDAETIGERLRRWSLSVISRSDSHDGQHKRHRVHVLAPGCTWGSLLHATARGMLGGVHQSQNNENR